MVGQDLIDDELFKSFVELHQAQLKSSRVPELYWRALFVKLKDEVDLVVQLF